MFLADFIALIFQLTPSALQDNKHVSLWLGKDGFSSVLLEVVIVPITTLSGTQNNKPWTRSFSIHNMNFTWDKTLQVKPSVCFGQCSCEDFSTPHKVGPDFQSNSCYWWTMVSGSQKYCHTIHFSEEHPLKSRFLWIYRNWHPKTRYQKALVMFNYSALLLISSLQLKRVLMFLAVVVDWHLIILLIQLHFGMDKR